MITNAPAAPGKHYTYAIIDSATNALVAVRLSRREAREYIKSLPDAPASLRVRRAKLTLFES